MSEAQPPVTMADVGRALGVHQTTISLALRYHPSIPPATREKVRAMASKMGYRRNPMVSALISEIKRRRPHAHGSKLALLTSGPKPAGWRSSSPSYARLFQLLVQEAEALGYGLEEFALNSPEQSPAQLRRMLLHRGIRGLLIAPHPADCHQLDFDFSDFATVALRYTLKHPQMDHVSIDYCATMETAVQHLLATGHRRITFLTDNVTDGRVNHLSLGVYLATRHLHPRTMLPPLILADWDAGIAGIIEQKPDAVIAPITFWYDSLKSHLHASGWKMPEKLSLVNLDCYPQSKEPGVVQNLEGEARAAVSLVTSRAERAQFGLPAHPQATLVKGTWRDGATFRPRRNA